MRNLLDLKRPNPIYGLLFSFIRNNNPLYQDMFYDNKWLHMIKNTFYNPLEE